MPLLLRGERLEAGRDVLQRGADRVVAGQWVVVLVVVDRRADSPVRALPTPALEIADQRALAQRAGLVDEDVAYPAELQEVVLERRFIDREGCPGVADENDIDVVEQGFETHVVVDAAVGEDDPAAQAVEVRQLALGPLPGVGFGLQYQRRENRRESAGRGDRLGERDVGGVRNAQDVVGDVVLTETEAAPGLHVRGVEDEARRVIVRGRGDLAQQGFAEQVAGVAPGEKVAGSHERRQVAEQGGAHVDGLIAELAHRLCDDFLEVARLTVDEVELPPAVGQHAGENRAAGNAGNARQAAQQPALVEPPEAAQTEKRRPESAAGQGQTDTRLLLGVHRSPPGECRKRRSRCFGAAFVGLFQWRPAACRSH
ncbi:MAG: hypothetical protein AW11_03789 [Candidatus Accumulibacter regalis]|uniref:Uncharacterized protein n=1 Tax=Accumulibacter regalis TaxID=522306 RepID=A0A011PAH1_ACCRE|nr:MAG: hypothetical protein AW11_03789 [Candidatus Accumulibacter regalis]